MAEVYIKLTLWKNKGCGHRSSVTMLDGCLILNIIYQMFHIELPDKTKVWRKFGLGTCTVYIEDGRNSLVCTSNEKVKDVFK